MASTTRQCIQCGARFQSIDLLGDHIQNVHTGAGPSNRPEPQGTTIGKHQCRHCGDSFTYAGLSQHITRGTCAALQERWRKQVAQARRARPRTPSSPPEGNSSDDHEDEDIEGSDNIDDVDHGMEGEDEVVGYKYEDANNQDGLAQDGPNSEDAGSHIGDAEDSDDSAREEVGSGSETVYSVGGSEDTMESDRNLPTSPTDAHLPLDPIVEDQAGERVILEEVVDQYGNCVYIEPYPIASAGEPIRQAKPEEFNQDNYPDVGDLAKPDFFEIVQVLMESGISGNFRNKYLRLKRLRGMMPWKNNRELLKSVDKLPHGPDWTVQAIKIQGKNGEEIVEMWMRNALDIVKQILGNKQLGRFIEYKAVKKWTTRERTARIRDELNTGDWMWEMQGKIQDEHGTVISVIISSDETRLTNFSGDKKAHPVYMTLGNLPKRLRRRISKRANILLGYLPVPKLDCEPNKIERGLHRRDLFHKCMRAMLLPTVASWCTPYKRLKALA